MTDLSSVSKLSLASWLIMAFLILILPVVWLLGKIMYPGRPTAVRRSQSWPMGPDDYSDNWEQFPKVENK